ncbi:MAG: hypothetical protein ACOC1U_11095, partial [Spirochaetota bacterium]
MSFAETVLRLGPFNVPLWLVGVLVGLGLTVLVQRTLLRAYRRVWSAANDTLSNAVIVGFLVWKLTPLVTRFDEIAAAPARLLYYPGGTVGLVSGVAAGALVGLLSLVRGGRSRERGDGETREPRDDPPPSARSVARQGLVPLGLVALC